ncbi:helix-turn-helix domain-containing protein [Roseovarius atlanticus]|uniref:helix-turn-helix domain-containing protein n=1 Tax=Roseovarius atlanticus TaxID=1641875 RepID=UPI001C94E14B|nr:AraC family transcriptional regulator [Roseovarius atlanticus]MBY5986335.1 AraC family transcriptional regulator [Roseovarius atlanticus]MBY6124975.1 AraC family transcriptional regulator [Roseovarius atlanticus]MBY6150564.1 AraC family transcriptional regulator [Roseovarius atlanticus]
MSSAASPLYFTVSNQFISDWLGALQPLCSEDHFASLLERCDLPARHHERKGRVTLDQIVRLYQLAAVETGDEMMGLWSRPIRPRALQHLLTSVREATSLASALYRFSTFWNLLLDDYRLDLVETDATLTLRLVPQGDAPPQRFGHMLILKLAHGLISWLARYEVPVKAVEFAFQRPPFEEDYAVIFPAQAGFGRPATSLVFDQEALGPVRIRTATDLEVFLRNAPRDWIFTRSSEHTQSLRVRAYLGRTGWENASLSGAARALHVTPRTLIRRLRADGTSFQSIKDALRRDIAIRHLQTGRRSVEAIAQDVGYSSAASFHKAFRRWTGKSPSAYRRADGPTP